ncbi:hypothetical protein ACNHRQ_25180, partial [Klebsiella aerogenes]
MDLIVSSTAKMYTDRLGIERYTIEGIRQNLIPLGRQYMTLADAQADIANIPVNSTTYVRNADGAVLADEYMNVGGTLQPTGRVMPGSAALMAPNLMQNSRAALTDKLPALFSGADSGGVWAAAGAEMAAQGAVQEVACPPRASTSDRAVNYLFQQDISFVSGGSYIATEMLYRGNTALIFTRVAPDTAATRISQRYEDLGNGTTRVTTLWKINGNAASPASVIYWGCQQSGSSVTSCEIAYPKIAISRRQIFGVGGDMSMADMLNQSGAVVNNFIYNSFADPRFSLPRLRVGSVSWTLVSTLTNTTIASALTSAGAVSCLVTPPVSSGYVDALVEPWVDETASPGMWGASQYYVYVDSVSGVNPRDEIRKAAVFFIDVDNGTVQVTPDVISQVSNNLFHVRASYQFANKPRRISMGVRQTGANSTFYVFGFFMGLAKQKIRDILESPTRDSSLGESLTGSARNIAFNPSADPAQQQQGLFGGGSWTPVASLPADVQSISTLGAKAAVSALRITSGYRDALANISLDGVKMGDYVRIEFGVYVNADAGVDIATALTKCCAFFWNTTGAFEQKTAQVKEKINDKTYTMTYQYQYLGADASRVYLGVRNT